TTAVQYAGTWAKKLSITVPGDAIDRAWAHFAGDVAARLRLPGFRSGKVPRAVAEKRFASDIDHQLKSDVVARAFRRAIDQEKLDVVGEPSLDPAAIELQRGVDLAFDVEVEIKPTFELPEYKGLQVEQEEVEVFEEEVTEQLEHLA